MPMAQLLAIGGDANGQHVQAPAEVRLTPARSRKAEQTRDHL